MKNPTASVFASVTHVGPERDRAMKTSVPLNQPLNLFEYQRLAKARMSPQGYDYYAAGAMDEITLEANHRSYDEIFLRPRVLTGVGNVDTKTTVLGSDLTMPVIVAPSAFHGLATPLAERATAGAAATAGVVYCMSTMANTRMEDVATVVPATRWFQLYVFKDRGVTRSLVERAEASGFTALELTVNTPKVGRREADERNHFALPAGLAALNLQASHHSEVRDVGEGSGLAAYFAHLIDDNLTWADVEWLRSITKLPILIKGIGRGDDAKQAVASGAAGVIVSNHGGRQLDTARPTIRALPEVVQAVGGMVPILCDGGIRRGTDILKALAVGAAAVQVGRPVLWGLAVDGEAGARRVLELLRAELVLAMALCGCGTIAAITGDLIG